MPIHKLPMTGQIFITAIRIRGGNRISFVSDKLLFYHIFSRFDYSSVFSTPRCFNKNGVLDKPTSLFTIGSHVFQLYKYQEIIYTAVPFFTHLS